MLIPDWHQELEKKILTKKANNIGIIFEQYLSSSGKDQHLFNVIIYLHRQFELSKAS